MPVKRLAHYAMPLIDDPELLHIRTIRLGSRALTYSPEMILSPDGSVVATGSLDKKVIISAAPDTTGCASAINRLQERPLNLHSLACSHLIWPNPVS